VRFLLIWSWDPANAREVSRRFIEEFKPPEGIKFLYPISTMLGANKGFTIFEAEREEAINRAVRGWLDLCTFDIYPIMKSEDAIKA